jgi:hypothetical protein
MATPARSGMLIFAPVAVRMRFGPFMPVRMSHIGGRFWPGTGCEKCLGSSRKQLPSSQCFNLTPLFAITRS